MASSPPGNGCQVIRCALRVGGSLEDKAQIIPQSIQPVSDVGGVLLAGLACPFQMRTRRKVPGRDGDGQRHAELTSTLP